jgi:hypothetical protein
MSFENIPEAPHKCNFAIQFEEDEEESLDEKCEIVQCESCTMKDCHHEMIQCDSCFKFSCSKHMTCDHLNVCNMCLNDSEREKPGFEQIVRCFLK